MMKLPVTNESQLTGGGVAEPIDLHETRPRLIRKIRLILTMVGVLTMLLGLMAQEHKATLLLGGLSLLLVGWLWEWILALYRTAGIILLTTILLFLGLELAATAILATITIPSVRGFVAQITDRPNDLVAHYLTLPYYTDQDWAPQYWQELKRALKKTYHPYVIWRSPSYTGRNLSVDEHGIRRTPGADCVPDAYRVFVFGGSSVWGWGSPDWGTIPAYLQTGLQATLDQPVCVVNFGENAYVSTQSLIQLILQLEAGNVPDSVIFYDGVNEVLAANQSGRPIVHQNLAQLAAVFQDPRPPSVRWAHNLNSLQLLQLLTEQLGAYASTSNTYRNIDIDQLADLIAEAYLGNYKIVSSLAQTYHFDVHFFWQPHILFGDKPLTSEEQKMITGLDWVLEMDHKLKNLFTATYKRIEGAAPDYENLHYLVNAFGEVKSQIWLDTWGHVTPPGNELITQAMMKVIHIKRAAK
jgi:lysophospholipase L1-like esterase